MSKSIQETHYAYGQEQSEIEAVMRVHSVKRWHMIDTTRTQTLAEHSANVALLVYLIAKKTNPFFGNPEVTATRALLHDMGEVFVGDIPSHTKRRIGGVEELEDVLLPTIFNAAPTRNEQLLIKICDLVDGIRFIRLHGVDVTARHARNGLEEQLESKWNKMMDLGWPAEVRQTIWDTVGFFTYENFQLGQQNSATRNPAST